MKFSDLWPGVRRAIEQRIAYETSPDRAGRSWPYTEAMRDNKTAIQMRAWNDALDALARQLYTDTDFDKLDLHSISPGMTRTLYACVSDAALQFVCEDFDETARLQVKAQEELLQHLRMLETVCRD